jgi:hypothetical protein
MMQPSLTFLTLSIPAAMKALDSFRSFDDLPDHLADGLIDMTEALMNCFPEAAAIYHPLHDDTAEAAIRHHLRQDGTPAAPAFNHSVEAYRILSPIVEKASYPISTEYGVMLADTPLTVALTPHQGMMLLQDCVGHANDIVVDDEFEALFVLTERLLEDHPAVKAAVEHGVGKDENGFDFFAEAYAGMTAATKAAKEQFGMAA